MKNLPLALGAAAAALALGACGSTSTSSTAASSSTTSAAGFDSCLVGDWTSTGVTLTVGGTPATTSGGEGEKFHIAADGTIAVDDSATTAIHASLGGSSQIVQQSGKGTGKLSIKQPGSIHLDLDPGSTLTNQQIDNTGAPVGTPSPMKSSADANYVCSAGQSLKIIIGSGSGSSSSSSNGSQQTVQTIIYAPAGSSSNSVSSSLSSISCGLAAGTPDPACSSSSGSATTSASSSNT